MKENKIFFIFFYTFLTLLLTNVSAQRTEFISNHQKAKFYVELKDSPTNWNEGFTKIISGQEIDYFSFNPRATHAIISRASDGKSSIEWETAPAQIIDENGFITFVWTAGINTNTLEQPFDLEVNGKKILTFVTRFAEEWSVNGIDDIKLKFSALYQDRNGDLSGYMFLTIPVDNLERGKKVSLKITGHAKETNNWMMVYTNSRSVYDFNEISQNGFWYRATLAEKEKEIKIEFPASWNGKTIIIRNELKLFTEKKLTKKNNYWLKFNYDSEETTFPLQIFSNGKKLDEIPAFTSSDESYLAEEDGAVIYRSWETTKANKIIENSKNEFITIPETNLNWPEYVQDFPSITMGKNNVIWMAVTERLARDSYISVYRVENNQRKKICMFEIENQTGIGEPDIEAYGHGAVVFFPIEQNKKWAIAYSFIDENNLANGKINYIKSDGTSNISPSVAVSGNEVFVVWESNAGESRGIYSCIVTKTGYSKLSRLSSSVYNSYNPAIISTENGGLFVAWDSYQNNDADIWVAKFINGKWNKEFRITSDSRIERHPELAINGSDIWMTWQAQSYGNTAPNHSHSKYIELNRVDEQRIVVAKLNGDKLDAPLKFFEKISHENLMFMHPKISFSQNGTLFLTARESMNHHDGWRSVLWNYGKNGWSDKSVLLAHRGRWQPIDIVCSTDSIYTAVQYDSRDKSGSEPKHPDKDWNSAIAIKTLGLDASSEKVVLQTEKLKMPHTHFSLTEKSELVSANFPRKEIRFNDKTLKLFFGDFHEHTDISICARDVNPAGHDLFANLRDIEKLDFCALTDHHTNLDRTIWSFNGEQTRNNHDPGRFVTFAGQEWSSSTGPSAFGYGHHNFIYLDPFLKSHITTKESYLKPNELWEKLNKIDFISIPHQLADWEGIMNSHGAWGNPPKDWNYYDEKFQPVAEIFQGRGSYEYYGCPRQAEGGAPFSMFYLQDAWKRGIIIGVIASPDHGGGYGKAGVWAEELTRESIFKAMQDRHTFGTTGAKMKLLFTSGSTLMGDKVMNFPDTLHFKVEAEAKTKIKEVVIFRNNRIIYRVELNKNKVELEWIDENPLNTDFAWYYVRYQTVDDEIAWSSPIWFIKD